MSALLVSLCVLSVCFYSASALAGQSTPFGGNHKHELQLPAEQRLFRFLPSPEMISPGTSSTEPPGASAASGSYHVLPVFVHAAAPLVDAEIFRPVPGARRLPDHVASLLLLPPPPSPQPVGTARNPRGVEVWCGRSKMSVRVNKRTLGFKSPASQLFLGSCAVSRSTKRYHYFHYGLGECGAARKTDRGRLVFSNSLRYVPERRGAVLRSLPVSLRVRCVYNRFHYVYKVGYLPEVHRHTVLKSLRSKRRFTLTAYNARWERLAPGKGYILGQPMYFEARAAFIPRSKRVFVNSCYASPSKEPNSIPQMDVVKNFGCMVDSKRRKSQSKFLSHKSKALRFTVDAFVFPKISAKVSRVLRFLNNCGSAHLTWYFCFAVPLLALFHHCWKLCSNLSHKVVQLQPKDQKVNEDRVYTQGTLFSRLHSTGMV
uniref:Zona pellucida sperm-binding protein 3 n=1 Tax=Scleropages formosus TaxID=113540 RepID=A0A8C9VU18_SCLFO